MTTNNAWNSPTYSAYQAHNFSGINSWSGAGSYYTIAGTTFTLDRGGIGYIKTTPITWAGGQSVGPLATGETYYIYIGTNGLIGSTGTRTLSLFQNNIVLFEVLVDASSNVIVVREDHPVAFPADSSEWAHEALGPIIANRFNGANIVLNGTRGIQINGTDNLLDHGLTTTIPDSAAAAVTWNFMYTNAAGKWVRDSAATLFPSVYNNAGVVTALPANRFGTFRLYACKDDIESSSPQYFVVINTATYASLNAARSAIISGIAAATNELYNLELAQLGYVIYSQASNSIVEVQISKSTGRNTPTGGGAVSSAALISTNTSAFDHALSATDTSVQTALNTLDDEVFVWTEITAGQTAVAYTGYIANKAGTACVVTLPATSIVGALYSVVGKGATGWSIAQNAGQTIHFGDQNTTPGAGGSLASTKQYDTVHLVCSTANTDFVVTGSLGNITVV